MTPESPREELEIPETCSRIIIHGFPPEIATDYDTLSAFKKGLGGEVSVDSDLRKATMTVDRGGNTPLKEVEILNLKRLTERNPHLQILFS